MRKPITVWLDDRKHEHADLLGYVSELKQARQFSGVIRDGLRLIRDLRAGSLDVLCELFPWVERALLDAIEAATKSTDGNSGNGDSEILSRLDALQRSIEAQQPGGYLQAPTTGPAPLLISGNMSELSGPQPVAARDTSADDDLLDLLEVKEVKSEGGKATENFIKSMIGMQNAKSTKDPDARPVRPIKHVTDLSELIVINQTQ